MPVFQVGPQRGNSDPAVLQALREVAALREFVNSLSQKMSRDVERLATTLTQVVKTVNGLDASAGRGAQKAIQGFAAQLQAHEVGLQQHGAALQQIAGALRGGSPPGPAAPGAPTQPSPGAQVVDSEAVRVQDPNADLRLTDDGDSP